MVTRTQLSLFPDLTRLQNRYFMGHYESPERQVKAAIAIVESLNTARSLELYTPETLKLITYSNYLPLCLLTQVAEEKKILRQGQYLSASKEFYGIEKRFYNQLLHQLMEYRHRTETTGLTKGDFLNDLAHFTQSILEHYDAAPFHIAAMIEGNVDSKTWVENQWYHQAIAYWKPTPSFRAWYPEREQRLKGILGPVYALKQPISH